MVGELTLRLDIEGESMASMRAIWETLETRLRRAGEPWIRRMVAGDAPAGIRKLLRARAREDIRRKIDFRRKSLEKERQKR